MFKIKHSSFPSTKTRRSKSRNLNAKSLQYDGFLFIYPRMVFSEQNVRYERFLFTHFELTEGFSTQYKRAQPIRNQQILPL